MKLNITVVFLVFAALVSGCGKSSRNPAELTPQHGGVIVELGDNHKHQLEVVLDRKEGSIFLHVFDAQNKKRVLTSNEGLELQVAVGSAESRFLILDPGSNTATEEIAGNTSFFRRLDTEWLKTKEPVKIVVDQIIVRGSRYQKVEILLPASQ